MPPAAALQDTVAVPDVDRLFGLMAEQVRPDGGLSVSDTVPVKPFWAVTAMVEVADVPWFTGAGEEDVIVKSEGGGPGGLNVRRHPHPIGLLLHCIAPYVPELGVLVQLPAGHHAQSILCGLLLSYRLTRA